LYDCSEGGGDVSFQIKSDEQVLQWFQMNLEKGVVHIDAQINDFDGPLQFSPTKLALHSKVRERLREKTLETPNTPSLDLDPRVEPTQLTPTKERNTSKRERSTHDEDVVRVDEDGMYCDTDPHVLSDSSYDIDLAASSDSDIDSSNFEYDPDVEVVDEDEEDIPPFSYDVDDPCIEVGVVFSDVKQCKKAVTQHAIIHDHAFRPTRSDHGKFRAMCKRADKGYKWRFYATISKTKYIGCKVKYVYTYILMCSCTFVINFSNVLMTMLCYK
jgi:hypothetical protein